MNQDMTIVYYTANVIPDHFMEFTKSELIKSAKLAGDLPIVSVSHKPMDLGENIVVDLERHTVNIYKQVLIGAKAAKTKYVVMAEDDALYSPDHFMHRPTDGVFAYNFTAWGIYTWVKPAVYSHKARHVMWAMMCERQLLIDALELRFAKYPDIHEVPLRSWSEPGKYERHLGLPELKMEDFYTVNPIIVFSHETAIAYDNLGKRKRLGVLRAYDIPYWGKAEDLLKQYTGEV